MISRISAYARCLAGKVCGLVRSTWGTSLGEDKPGARDQILNTKVAHRARAGQTFPPRWKDQQLREKIPKGVDGAVDLQTKIYDAVERRWSSLYARHLHTPTGTQRLMRMTATRIQEDAQYHLRMVKAQGPLMANFGELDGLCRAMMALLRAASSGGIPDRWQRNDWQKVPGVVPQGVGMDETARNGHPDEGTAGVGCKNPDCGSGVSTSARGNMVPHTTPHQRGGAHVYARAVGESCVGHGAGCVRGVAITILREGSDATPTRPQTQLSCSDWICPGCANHTWASRVCCKRCQQPNVSKVGPGNWMCQRCSIVYLCVKDEIQPMCGTKGDSREDVSVPGDRR